MEFWMAMPTAGPENEVALRDRSQGHAPRPGWPELRGLWEGAGV